MRGNEIQWTTRMGMVLTWKTPTSSLSLAVFEIMYVIQGFICKLQTAQRFNNENHLLVGELAPTKC